MLSTQYSKNLLSEMFPLSQHLAESKKELERDGAFVSKKIIVMS